MKRGAENTQTYPFHLEPLAFDYDALEPYIDGETLRIHHWTHHQANIANLNAAIKDHPELHGYGIEVLLRLANVYPANIRRVVRDQGGAHLHHRDFWSILKPGVAGAYPAGTLAYAIARDFGSFASFKKIFVDAGVRLQGPGWVELAVDEDGRLDVNSLAGNDHSLLEGKTTLLINDLWEHAYYLKYRSDRMNDRRDRAAYLNACWNIINWEHVNQRLERLHVHDTPSRREPFQLVSRV